MAPRACPSEHTFTSPPCTPNPHQCGAPPTPTLGTVRGIDEGATSSPALPHPTVSFIPNIALSVASNRLLIMLSLMPLQSMVKYSAASTGVVNSVGEHEHGADRKASHPRAHGQLLSPASTSSRTGDCYVTVLAVECYPRCTSGKRCTVVSLHRIQTQKACPGQLRTYRKI